MPPGRDWLDYATLTIALVALAVGIWNSWASRSRVEIALIGAFAPPSRLDEELETNATIEIYNPGTHPILLTEAGFTFQDGMKHVVGKHPATSSSQRFPYRLQGRDSFLVSEAVVELVDQAINHANPATHVWVRAAGGRYKRKGLPQSWIRRYAAEAQRRIGSP